MSYLDTTGLENAARSTAVWSADPLERTPRLNGLIMAALSSLVILAATAAMLFALI